MSDHFFTELEQIISQFVWKNKKPRIAKAILRKKNGTGRINLQLFTLQACVQHSGRGGALSRYAVNSVHCYWTRPGGKWRAVGGQSAINGIDENTGWRSEQTNRKGHQRTKNRDSVWKGKQGMPILKISAEEALTAHQEARTLQPWMWWEALTAAHRVWWDVLWAKETEPNAWHLPWKCISQLPLRAFYRK